MAGSLNRVMIIGNLGRDPESRSFANGGKACNLSVAVSETWRDRNTGERKERTEWISVAILNEGLCGIAEQYLRKGSKVYVCGSMKTRKWTDQQGNDRYTTEVVLQGYGAELILLDGNSSGRTEQASQDTRGGGGHTEPFQTDLDDDVPFISCAGIW